MKHVSEVLLTDICQPKQWPTISQEQLTASGFPVYGANGVIGCYSSYNHEFPTILVTCRGATCGTINICQPKSYVTGNAMALDDLDTSRVSFEYLSHFLRFKGFKPVITGAAQPQITRQGLSSYTVLLPSLNEQRRIADMLNSADYLRTKRREAIEKINLLTQSIFLEMFGDPTRNTKSFPAAPLADLAEFENGDRSSNYPSGDDLKSEGILFLNTKNIVNDNLDLGSKVFITKDKFASLTRGKLRKNDLIITLRGTLGSCCVFDKEFDTGFINAQMMIIRPKSELRHLYLYSLLTCTQMKDHLNRIGHGAAVPQLTAKQLGQLLIIHPSLQMQDLFVKRIIKVRALSFEVNKSQSVLESLFASVQNTLLGGGF